MQTRKSGTIARWGAGLASIFSLMSQSARSQDLDGVSTEPTGQTWSLTLGGMVGVAPHYDGADRDRVQPLPFFGATYRDTVSVGLGGIGVTVLRADGFTVTPTLGYGGGRKESWDSELKGLGTIEPALTAGVLLKYQTGPFMFSVTPREAVIQERDGFSAVVAAGYAWHATPRLEFTFGPELTLADGKREQTYFGIDALQSARSGKRLYSPGGGVENVGAGGGVTYRIDDHWQLLGRVSDHVLVGDAADSPIVRSKSQASATTGIAYHF